MENENEDAIDEIINNLNRIPKKIESRIMIDEISEALINKLRKKISL